VTDPAPYRVEEKATVLDDYVAIALHVERWTEDRALADRTVDAIRAFVRSLGALPHRGTRRDDLRPGLRVVPFKTRTAVAFEVDDERRVVTVLRVFYGGQDYEAALRGGRRDRR
jgi:toxin ParE1/3/4